MTLKPLESIQTFKTLLDKHHDTPFLIYKHSEVCTIALAARKEVLAYIEETKEDASFPIYEVEVRLQRPLSMLIAQTFDVEHASPQILLIQNGKQSLWNASHFSITHEKIKGALKKYLA